MENRDLQVSALREALEEGVRSGSLEAFDFDAFIEEKRR